MELIYDAPSICPIYKHQYPQPKLNIRGKRYNFYLGADNKSQPDCSQIRVRCIIPLLPLSKAFPRRVVSWEKSILRIKSLSTDKVLPLTKPVSNTYLRR